MENDTIARAVSAARAACLPRAEIRSATASACVRSSFPFRSATYDTGRVIREGIDTAIVGRPNVGKSTLMNLLSGFQRSIVSNSAGTTRDVVSDTPIEKSCSISLLSSSRSSG